MKKLIEKYDRLDSLITISLYPKRGEIYSQGTSGVASYAKNLAINMRNKIVVLCDYDNNPEIYEEKNTLVIRCFKRNSPLKWVFLLKELLRFKITRKVLVQFDFSIYGGVFSTSLIIPFLLTLKLSSFQASIVLHHVILDINKLSGHVGLQNNFLGKLKGKVYNFFFHLFYKSINVLTIKSIVLEETLKCKLGEIIPLEKISAIFHGVDSRLTQIPKNKARKILGLAKDDYVVMFFGYVNWFKGADLFTSFYQNTDKMLGHNIRFLIAGGKSPTMNDKTFYKSYFDKVLEQVYASKNIEITGYIPQNKIALYFSACDLVVFPYRHYMTASGVLSLAFSYEKPFIISENLSEMFTSEDFKNALLRVGLSTSDIVFKLNQKSSLDVMEKVLKNGIKSRMVEMTKIMKSERSYKNTAFLYEKVLFSPIASFGKKWAFAYSHDK